MSNPNSIIHLAVDFNTPQRAVTTNAVEWFVRELEAFDNVVIAYRRVPRPVTGTEQSCEANGFKLFDFPYFGLPLGLGLKAAMREAAMRTISLLDEQGIRPKLIHAHKLTFEGIAGWYIARHYSVPLFVSLRGEVETKVFRRKPLLRPFLRRLSQDAARLYFVSAWFRDEFHAHVKVDASKERLLPNIVRNTRSQIAPRTPDKGLVAVMKLDTWRRKGLPWLLDAVMRARVVAPNLTLDIIGGGSPDAIGRVTRMISDRKLEDAVKLLGPVTNATLLEALPAYRALVLPSVNETFGMVYVEALFAGVPILYTQGTGIDGYLDGLDVGRAVRPGHVSDISDAMLDLWENADGFRQRIEGASAELLARFDPGSALDQYRRDVIACCS
jgi:glycosyltransferase involved in cell wall biosynthesis